jgi:hypothetical protein
MTQKIFLGFKNLQIHKKNANKKGHNCCFLLIILRRLWLSITKQTTDILASPHHVIYQQTLAAVAVVVCFSEVLVLKVPVH